MVALATAAGLAAPVLAESPTDKAIPPNTFIDSQPEAHYLAKDVLIGAKVQGSDGKIIGDEAQSGTPGEPVAAER